MKKTILSMVLLSCINSVSAQWGEVSEANDGGYFVMTKSLKFDNSYLAVHMNPSSECMPVLQNIFLPTEAPTDAKNSEVLIRTRVDRNTVRYTSGTTYIRNGYVFYNWAGITMLEEIVNGKMFIFDDGDANSLLITDRFSLIGSKSALNELYNQCNGVNQWNSDNTEWGA